MNAKRMLAASVLLLLLRASASAATASVVVDDVVVGTTPRYIGFSQGHYLRGSNTSAWVKRSQANCFRIWAAPSFYEPRDDRAPRGDGVTDRASFEARRAALRADPENPAFINWRSFNKRFEKKVQTALNRCTLNYMCAELQRLGVEPIVVLNRQGWQDDSDWAGKWEHWQYYYAMAYHLAKNYDVAMFEPFNEPDHTDVKEIPSQALYIGWTRFASDAIRAAVTEVNTRYGKHLEVQILAPALTRSATAKTTARMDAERGGDPRDDKAGWGQTALSLIDTDIDGKPGNAEMFNVYSTHKYNAAPGDYFDEMTLIKDRMVRYHPSHRVLPVFYSEFNRYGSSLWMKPPYNATSLDTPEVYTNISLCMAKAMLGGVYGMTAFKFSNTCSETYGYQRTGHHFVFDTAPYDIGGSRKGAEAMRLFAKGFKGARDRYKTTTTASAGGYNSYTAHDAAQGNFHILAINSNDSESYAAAFDLSALDVAAGSPVVIEELSEAHQAEAVELVALPATKAFTRTQPSESVWLITVPDGPAPTAMKLPAVADAEVRSGASAKVNFGTATTMHVRGGKADGRSVSYLKFDLTAVPSGRPIRRAVLQVRGRNVTDNAPFSFHVYGDTNDNWAEETLAWSNAPDLDPAASRMVNVGGSAWPIGDLTMDGTAKTAGSDVTDWVREQQADGAATFVLIRERRFEGDDDAGEATISTREAEATEDRPMLVVYY